MGFTLRVPATIANLGPGFDSFGLALKFYNHFHFKEADRDEIVLAPGACVEGVPLQPSESLVFQGVSRFYEEIGKKRPALKVAIEPHIPLARGLGSSSTAIVAGLTAGNMLEGDKLDKRTLVRLATELEGHPDNVTPALLGGAVLCDGDQPYPLPWPEAWKICVIIPPEPVLTEEARRVLPFAPSLDDAIFNLRKASLLTYALLTADARAFGESLEDRLHQPYRARLIPDFENIYTLGVEYDAFGAIISGSGSTMALFYPDAVEADLLGALENYKFRHKRELRILKVQPDTLGAHTAKLVS